MLFSHLPSCESKFEQMRQPWVKVKQKTTTSAGPFHLPTHFGGKAIFWNPRPFLESNIIDHGNALVPGPMQKGLVIHEPQFHLPFVRFQNAEAGCMKSRNLRKPGDKPRNWSVPQYLPSKIPGVDSNHSFQPSFFQSTGSVSPEFPKVF